MNWWHNTKCKIDEIMLKQTKKAATLQIKSQLKNGISVLNIPKRSKVKKACSLRTKILSLNFNS